MENVTHEKVKKIRDDHPDFTDEHISSLVDKAYPKLYEDNLEVAIEIIKELYRRPTEWDESFLSLLREMTEGRKLVRYGADEKKRSRVIAKVNPFLERLYKEAQSKTIFLSECPEYRDGDVQHYFAEINSDKGKALAQKFFALLNNMALRDSNQVSGYVLPFHCYEEPNGDIVFTKNKRTRDDCDADGNPIVCEHEIEARLAKNLPTSSFHSIESNVGQRKSGCLGITLFLFVIITSFFL